MERENEQDGDRGRRDLEIEVEQLRGALQSRIVIEQAKGAISAAAGVTIEEAFQRLRRHARDHQRDIHLVAADAVRNRGQL